MKKITYTERRGMDNEANITQNVDAYIKSKLTPSSWQYDTYEQRLEAENENIMEALTRLLAHMCDSGSMSAQQLAVVVGDSGDVAFECDGDNGELKVGDRVVVDLSGLDVGDECHIFDAILVSDMFEHDGKKAVVTGVFSFGIDIDIDCKTHAWSPKWLRKC